MMNGGRRSVVLTTAATATSYRCNGGGGGGRQRSSNYLSLSTLAVSSLRTSSLESKRRSLMTLLMNDTGVSGRQSHMTMSTTKSRCLSTYSSYPFYDSNRFQSNRKRTRRRDQCHYLSIGRTRDGTTGIISAVGKNGDRIAQDNILLLQDQRIRLVAPGWNVSDMYHQLIPPVSWIPYVPRNNLRPSSMSQQSPHWNYYYYGPSSPILQTMAATTTTTRSFVTISTTTTTCQTPISSVWCNKNHYLQPTTPYVMLTPSGSRIALSRSSIRFMTTNKNKGDEERPSSTPEDSSPTKPPNAEKSNTTDHQSTSGSTSSSSSSSRNPVSAAATAATHNLKGFVDSTVSSVRPIVGTAEATIKRAVQEWNTSDLLSVYGIVFLIIAISTAPLMARHMRRSDSTYDGIDPEDPVMDLAQMIRGEYWWSSVDEAVGEDVVDAGGTSAMGLDRIVADVIKSPKVEEAITNLVTRVIQSPQFKRACQVLLKELLQDLLNDPDTLTQVIHLLNNAIQDKKIKDAAVQLVMDVFGDDQVLDELVVLVQRLGMEDKVQQATQALLVESAHNALNDPEILDHSMEFATDVVGDDVVQQTAGEALYNTLAYAATPTLSVLLSMLGVGLIFLSIAAFRNANRPPDDAIDKVFLDTLETHTSTFFKILSLPLDLLVACKDAVVAILLLPFRLVSAGLSRSRKVSDDLIDSVHQWLLWLLSFPGTLLSSLLNGSREIVDAIGKGLAGQATRLMSVIDQSFVGGLFRTIGVSVSGVTSRTRIQWIILNRRVSDAALAIENFGMETAAIAHATFDGLIGTTSNAISNLRLDVSNVIASMVQEQKVYHELISTKYDSLNKSLEEFAFSLERFFRRLISPFRNPKSDGARI